MNRFFQTKKRAGYLPSKGKTMKKKEEVVLYAHNTDGEAVFAVDNPSPTRETGWDDCDHFYLNWYVVPPYFGITETDQWVDCEGRWQEGEAPSSIVFKSLMEFNDFSHSTEVV